MSHSYLNPISGTPRHLHNRAAMVDAYYRTGDSRYLRDYSDQQAPIPPAAAAGDTAHSQDTTLGVAGSFWLEQLGGQFQGLAQALTQGSGLMWLGVGVVIFFLVTGRKGRR